MDWGRWDPFLTTGDDGRSHEMVIDDVSEVIGWEAIGLHDDDIDIVVGEFELTSDGILELDLLIVVPHRLITDDPWGSGFDLLDLLVDG